MCQFKMNFIKLKSNVAALWWCGSSLLLSLLFYRRPSVLFAFLSLLCHSLPNSFTSFSLPSIMMETYVCTLSVLQLSLGQKSVVGIIIEDLHDFRQGPPFGVL